MVNMSDEQKKKLTDIIYSQIEKHGLPLLAMAFVVWFVMGKLDDALVVISNQRTEIKDLNTEIKSYYRDDHIKMTDALNNVSVAIERLDP